VDVTIELWTDGACSQNPGPGGWAFVLVARRADGTIAKRLERGGGAERTTNNQMELQAVIEGLGALIGPAALTIYTDSAYVEKPFTEGWIVGWQRNGWRTGRGKQPVKNQGQWQALLVAIAPHAVSWERVKGHSNHALNNRCDVLAVHQREMYAGRVSLGTPPPPS
jgi:ribonuclease HI